MKNKFLENGPKKECNGCGICTYVCPVQAITMIKDEEGFLYPHINEEKCIKCNKCKNVCSNFNIEKQYEEKVYATYTRNKDELSNCSSGGMFYIIAKYVIENDGVVFGVKYDENLKAVHDYSENLEECKKFRGSKYVRSDTKDSYSKVKEFLNQEKMVLFTGTPCQCNALKVYLGKDYQKLITCDIICHANPSPKVFEKYKEELASRKNKKIKNIYFRSKENGWRNQTPIVEYEDGEKEEEATYYTAFVRELLGRPSCNSCKFATINRATDFTIGDLWGVEKIKPELSGTQGISILTINSNNAEKIFEKIKKDMNYYEINKELAYSCNHYKNVPVNKNRDKFFEKIDSEKSIITLMKKYSKVSIISRIKRKIGSIIKKMIKK